MSWNEIKITSVTMHSDYVLQLPYLRFKLNFLGHYPLVSELCQKNLIIIFITYVIAYQLMSYFC